MTRSPSLPAGTALLDRAGRQAPRLAAGAMAFLGAFLSFSMEPIVGRMVTPYFGGAVHVWVVSLMMFQALLLLGYVYAHLVAPRIGPWHLLLLILPLLQWPLDFSAEFAPQAPIAALIGSLLAQISLPFAVLCTTAVVAQSWWYGASTGHARAEPYFLYGISNLGAIVALFVYPFLVEPLFGVAVQRWAWSIGYLFYAGVTAWTWFVLQPRRAAAAPAVALPSAASGGIVLRWLALSAAPSALLLAATNLIAMEVGSFPLVWVFPLALYLASFIVTFRPRHGPVTRRLHFWMIEIALLALLAPVALVRVAWALPLILLLFYALCVIANEELYRLRPHPARLTGYYLTVSVGGLIGGVLVSLVAPAVLTGLQEYPIAVLAVVVAGWRGTELAWWRTAPRIKGYPRMALVVIGCVAVASSLWEASSAVHASRNFYGVSRIVDAKAGDGSAYRMLVHGATLHGTQYLDPARRREALTYYWAGGALEQAVAARSRSEPVAMIGLGAGGALPWFGPGEAVTVFEIDPDMEGLARRWFTYLDDTAARVAVRVGDARLNLQEAARSNAARYGVVFVDAFSGDGIPTHLMTLEALDVYLAHLAPDGLLVFHVSNRYYDFRPVLKAAAQARGLAAVATASADRSVSDRLRIHPQVVVLARRPERLKPLLDHGTWTLLGTGDDLPAFRAWTDDYVNVLAPVWSLWRDRTNAAP